MSLTMAETSRPKLVQQARAARVLERWRGGKSTHEIAADLSLAESEVCRILEESDR
ncbi:hypothetical protein RHIZ_07755 [Rhizobium skierniewicense]|uniref:hypothetical protein n=1 Tax=Rhizobium skierniewicense TaxID=984260 RepID=UPI001FADB79A|nr:hypothetical protein [Rhizobium skierniewicense]MCI9865833.1 hypothetical protein [Rhizobium skierniewicense]